MCTTCGCGESHNHPHEVDHLLEINNSQKINNSLETVTLEQKVLAKNDALAEANRERLAGLGILAVNLMSSPGSGKTTLLERTIRDTAGRRGVAVIEGDQETPLDADRIRRTGCPVVQVNTGAGCHLEAKMVGEA